MTCDLPCNYQNKGDPMKMLVVCYMNLCAVTVKTLVKTFDYIHRDPCDGKTPVT